MLADRGGGVSNCILYFSEEIVKSKPVENLLPSPKLIIILENRDYMAGLKEKLAEIKGVYRSLKLVPVKM